MTTVRLASQFRVKFGSVPNPDPDPAKKYIGFRALHGVEGGRMPPAGMPEVVPPIEVKTLEMTKAVQTLAWKVLTHYCPPLPKKRFPKIHSYNRAMNNFPQNGYGGGIEHADWINLENTLASNPRYDKMQRMMGGSFMRGVDMGNGRIRVDPGVHAIDATKTLPSVQEVVDNQWVVFGVSIGASNFAQIDHFPQTYVNGVDYPCAFLFIIDRPIYFRRDEFDVWESDTLPDPTKIYKPLPANLWRTGKAD